MLSLNRELMTFEELGKKLLLLDETEIFPFIQPYIAEITHLAVSPKNDEVYGRKILFSSPEIEIMVALWKPQGLCLPHNHGASRGRVILLNGNFSEQSYILDGGKLTFGQKQNYKQGQTLNVCQSGIHSMKSMDDHGLSLHIYSPSIHEMSVYDTDKSLKYLVVDDCGAWRPRPEQILSSENLEAML